MGIGIGPCEWPLIACHDVDADEDSCGQCNAYGRLDEDKREIIDAVATEYLWRWTGKRFGRCEITVRPCREQCCDDVCGYDDGVHSSSLLRPVLIGGNWHNLSCGSCGDSCSCDSLCEVMLPGPVDSIVDVLVDGIPLLDVEYRVDNHRRLVRVPWADHGRDGTDFDVDSSNPAAGIFRYADYGIWNANVTGWSGSLDLPTSQAAGDSAQTQWPPAVSSARGQYVRMWVPPLTSVAITTPERGVTIWRTPPSDSNGPHDDVAGTYGGGAEGREYLVRFDGDQAVEWTAGGPGVEVREIGFLTLGDDDRCWPTCQRLDLPTTEPGTFAVTYRRGVSVPHGGQVAAWMLACELAKAWCGSDDCALPKRVQTITRQGVTMALLDDGAGLERGRTGIFLVDSWVASIVDADRQNARRGGKVFSINKRKRFTNTSGT